MADNTSIYEPIYANRPVYSGTHLSDLSAYRNYVIGESKHKTTNGFVNDSSYYKKYYSMIDVEIYFGDVYISDVHDISWTLQQNQQELFGYNSYCIDEYALGARKISGRFTINFTGAGIMDKIIDSAQKSESYPSSYTVSTESGTISEHKNTGAVLSPHDDTSAIWKPVFDIDVVCMGDSKGLRPAHIVIQDVNVSACGMATSANGGNLQSAYTFAARDIKNID